MYVCVCVSVATVNRSARQAFNSVREGRRARAAWALATKRSEELELLLLLPTAHCQLPTVPTKGLAKAARRRRRWLGVPSEVAETKLHKMLPNATRAIC